MWPFDEMAVDVSDIAGASYAFPGVATWLACVPLLLALAFMADCKNAIIKDFEEVPILKGQTCSAEVGGFCAHIMFMLGSVACGWAVTAIGAAMGLSPSLCGALGVPSFAGIMLAMQFSGAGPTGMPGIQHHLKSRRTCYWPRRRRVTLVKIVLSQI